MSAREALLTRLRAAEAALGDHPLPDVPRFAAPGHDRLRRFRDNLAILGGQCERVDDVAALRAWFDAHYAGRDCCSAAPELPGTRRPDPAQPPAALHDVDVAVVRARHGVAETGSVWLSEAEYRVNALGYLAQHLVVLLDPARVVDGIQDIYRLPDFGAARYAALVTGPSATADIEGVLVRGAQGVRSLTVVLLPEPGEAA